MKRIVVALAFLSVALITIGKAAPRGGRGPAVNCMHAAMDDCHLNGGPVCTIDASGIAETFENKCMAYVIACQRNTFFVEVKPGEC